MKQTALRRLCTAALIAALYVALTLVMGPFAYSGFLNLRPSEALTVLPVLFPEAIPGLYVGCLIANIASEASLYDIFLGSLVTLVAAALTRLVRNVWIGGIFPVLLNAIFVPLILLAAGVPDVVYWYSFLSILATQAIWYYVLGVPLCFGLRRALGPRIPSRETTERRKPGHRRFRRSAPAVSGGQDKGENDEYSHD